MTTNTSPHDVKEADAAPRSAWPTTEFTWVVIAIAAPVLAALFAQNMAIDLAYQIRAGEMMIDTRSLLDHDVFTFTVAGRPWLNQQWGAQVLLGAAFRTGGWFAIELLRGALLGASLVFVYLSCRASGAARRTSALLACAGWLVGIEILPELRPQAFAFLLFTMTLWAITTRGTHPARLWLVPLLVVPWANVHGSFPLAIVLLVFAWIEDRRRDPGRARTIVVVALVSALASLVNPYGVRVWSYVFELSTHPVVSRRVAEWGPPSIHSWTGRLFFISMFAVVALLARRRDPTSWLRLAKLGAFAVFALLAIRGVVWWGLVAPVVVAEVIGDAGRPKEERSPINAVMLGAVVVLLLGAFAVGRGQDPLSGGPAMLRFAPERLVAAARASVPPGSRAFVSQLYASWSEFSAPELPVAVDPRIEIFPEHVWQDYFVANEGRDGWEEVLDRWQVDVLLLEPGQSDELIRVVGDAPDWELVTGDERLGWVFVRS